MPGSCWKGSSTDTLIEMSNLIIMKSSHQRFLSLLLVTLTVAIIMIIQQTTSVAGFIKFGYILNTTACDICDELRTYSGRNVFCCLAQSKCCGPNSLDELEVALTTVAP